MLFVEHVEGRFSMTSPARKLHKQGSLVKSLVSFFLMPLPVGDTLFVLDSWLHVASYCTAPILQLVLGHLFFSLDVHSAKRLPPQGKKKQCLCITGGG